MSVGQRRYANTVTAKQIVQRSAAAAKEIKLLIGDSVDKVREGSTLVEQSGTEVHLIFKPQQFYPRGDEHDVETIHS